MEVKRLSQTDIVTAERLFATMAEVFDEERQPLGDDYLDTLLARADFWALAALEGDEVLGGLTAHTLPMTRCAASEVLLFDLAVRVEHQRRGIGRALVGTLQALAADAGINVVFVPADNEDTEALEFYRAVGGVAEAVTIFTFSHDRA
jgi:aminoglycoside 3-N-acetyltransferase I